MKLTYTTGVLLALLAGTFWSFVPVGVREFQVADVWQILLYRSIGVLPLVFVLLHLESGGKPFQTIRQSNRSVVIGAIGLVLAYAGAIASIRMTNIANAAFLFATAPFFAALFSKWLLGETLRRFTIIALLLALCGTFIMVYDSFSAGNWLGDFLALMSAIGFATFAVSLRANRSTSSLPVVFLGASFSVGLGLLMCLTIGSGIQIPIYEVVFGLCLGAFVLGVGMIICSFASQVVPAAELTLLCMTEIILAPVWAWLFLDEIPPAGVLIGGTVIVSSLVLNAISGMSQFTSARAQ